MFVISLLSNVVLTLVVVHLFDVFMRNGIGAVLRKIGGFLVILPGADAVVKAFTKKEVDGFISQTFQKDTKSEANVIPIPEKGIPAEDLRKELLELKCGNGNLVEEGKLFAYVYTMEGPRMELQREAFNMFTNMTLEDVNVKHTNIVKAYLESFIHDNALNPMVFPALRKFENEVVAMTASMLHGNSRVVGSVTSGGTESILMAMKTYRDRARHMKPRITNPNVVAPATIHPAFEKAAHYFNLTIKHVTVDQQSLTCDVTKYEEEIDSNTILLLASAPSYPQAILDPIEEISRVALRHNLPFHVDACFGGFMLPWVEKLGYKVPMWDFRVPAVTSISADLHKYGFATKGASVVCYRDSSFRKFQFFAYSGWSGGLFASPTMAGTRPGGHLAGAWAALRAMGQDGYVEMARKLMDTANKMKEGINNIEGLKVLGQPIMSAFGFGSIDKNVNIFGVADVMEKKGIPRPRNVNYTSHNLNAMITWDPPRGSLRSNESYDVYDDVIVTYTVQYWANEGGSEWSWQTIPNCVDIRRHYCKITKLYLYEWNEYVVLTTHENMNSDNYDATITYTPYIEESLYAPKFTVSVNNSVAILKIPNSPRAYWSDLLLSDALSEDYLTYNIQYWVKNNSSGNLPARTISRSATFDEFEIKIGNIGNQTMCFRMKLQGITFPSAGWSDVMCNSSVLLGNDVPRGYLHGPTLLKTLFPSFGGAFLLVVMVILMRFCRKLYVYMKASEDKAIPDSLKLLMSQNYPQYPVVDEIEYVTLFKPSRIVFHDDVIDSDCCDKKDDVIDFKRNITSSPSNCTLSNDYVSSICGKTIPKLTIDTSRFDDVTDDVKPPASPDSGWKLEVQRNPDSVHCTILPGHIKSSDQWLIDLREAVQHVRKHGTDTKQGNTAIYGMLSVVPSDGIIDNFLVDLFDEIYKT